MKRKILFFLSIFLLFFCITSCSKKTSSNSDLRNSTPITLIMAEVNPENSICGKMDKAFKDKVYELSEGRINIDVHYSGILGDEKQVINMMLSDNSKIHITRGPANLSSYGFEKSKILSVPYTFTSPEHFWIFANSSLGQELLDEPYEQGIGIKGLCYAQEGFRNFFSTYKIASIQDIKNKNMRVAGQILTDLCTSLDANPVQVPFTDLYMALQLGTVDVAEQPLTNYLSNGFYDVAPYLILDHHMLGAVQIMINSPTWDSLTTEQQDILSQAAKYASNYCRILAEEDEISCALKLIEEGVQITEVPDIEEWKNACKNMISESTKDFQDLYNQILKLSPDIN